MCSASFPDLLHSRYSQPNYPRVYDTALNVERIPEQLDASPSNQEVKDKFMFPRAAG